VPNVLGDKHYAYERTFAMYYAEIPIVAKITLGNDNFYMSLFAGPSINFKLAALDTKQYTSDDNYNNNNGYTRKTLPGINVTEITGIVGIGLNAKYGDQIFFIDGRFSAPFTRIGAVDGKNIQNQYFTIGLGYIY
jgi:hypothetical protein